MYTRKTIQELTLKDDFMFGAVMSEEANCKRFLELVLGFPIDRVETNKEKSIIYRPENKGIRLDVYAKDENNTHYNVEMQTSPKDALGKRSRYYHSQIDMELLTFLNYVWADLENSAADFGDDYVKSLQDSVKLVKQSREMEQQFMILQELIDAGREEGRAEAVEGLTSAILTLLASKGTVTDELRMRITSENDLKLLRNWLDLAVKSTSVEQYVLQINS